MLLLMLRKMAMLFREVEVPKEEELIAVWLQVGEEVGGDVVEEEVEAVEEERRVLLPGQSLNY